MKKTFLTVGGDLRQSFLCNKLSEFGKIYALGLNDKELTQNVITLNSLEELDEKIDVLILPLPVTNDGVQVNISMKNINVSLYSLLPFLKPNTIVFGGKVGEEASIFTYKGIEVIDYLKREELSIMNAIPTGEGAIMIALEEMSSTLYNSEVLITGFGRISKVLVEYLKAFGAKITVAVRKYDQLEWAKFYGCNAIFFNDAQEYLEKSDLIINTVPSRIFTKSHLSSLKENCLIIDLASKPGGLDFELAKNIGIKAIWALSLPGKVAPVTAGEMIADTLINILKERKLL